MTIEFAEEDFKAIEENAGEIRSLATRARMGTDEECRHCLGEIINHANGVVRLLNNGLINNEDEVELSR